MLDNLFLSVLNMSLVASYVIIFVLLVRLALKKTPKIFSYVLWSVVVLRLISPFSFESVFSLISINKTAIPQDIIYSQAPQISTGMTVVDNIINPILPVPTDVGASINPIQVWLFIGEIIWIAGIIAMAVYSIIAFVKLKRSLITATPLKENIYLADHISTPFVLGIIKPKIYLPSSLLEEEQSYIIRHELCHIKRLDHITRILGFIALSVHWFNPLVWVAFVLSGKDMELSCDEAVMKSMDTDIKVEYSQSLLRFSTTKKTIHATPLAFGEGDTKDRVKNVLNYKKPKFWVVVAALIGVICLVISLIANPRQESKGFAGVNAVILEIDKDTPTMTVMGIDKNSVIGDRCIVSWEPNALITVATNSGPRQLTIDDFSVGNYVVLSIDEVQETYPTRTIASTIQLQHEMLQSGSYSAKDLWLARTQYIGDNSAVGNLIGLLPMALELNYDHFELDTAQKPYQVEIFYAVPTERLAQYDTENPSILDHFRRNALVLLALIDNADQVRFVFTDSNREVGFIQSREWAEYTMGEDVRNFAESSEKLQKLIDSFSEDLHFDDSKPEYTSQWPDNAYTDKIPMPEYGVVNYVIDDSTNGHFSVFIKDVTMEQSQAYLKDLKAQGYTELEATVESVSVGTLLTMGDVTLSIAYSDGVMGVTITM
ncbi:MAG: M56 family metallopeptidase [Brevinema sp.]